MSDSDEITLAHDFEVLLRYVAKEKVMLTPKQKCIPVRHIKNMIENFRVKEPHEEKVGDRIYKKRHEMEYRRFYFLDLLALSGEFLIINRRGRLAKGCNWQKFFDAPMEGRPFYLFCTFRAGFNAENWFLHRGGGFGERLEEKWHGVWPRLAEWKDGRSIEWDTWAEKIIEDFGLHWVAPDQTFAKKNMIWGLQYCLIEPMEYFGILEREYRQGEYSQQLHRIRLNPTGIDYFKRLDFGSKILRDTASWFSAN